MNSPAKLLTLWKKAVKKHEEGKKPADLSKKGQEHKSKIQKGLTKLKVQGARNLAEPEEREVFLTLRDRVVVVMTKYCRYLKTAKDEDRKLLPRHLKTTKQLTVLVKKLEPKSLDQTDEEVGLDALEVVDTSALDQALEQPDTDADVDLDDVTPPAPPPSAPAADGARAGVIKRLNALGDRLKAVLARKGPEAGRVQQLFTTVNGHLGSKDFEAASGALDQLEALLEAPPAPSASPQLAVWQQAKDLVDAQLRKLQDVLRKTGLRPLAETADEMGTVLARFRTSLVTALMELDGAAGDRREKARTKALQVISIYQQTLAKDRHILAADTNPFGVPVTIRDTLGKALTALERNVSSGKK
jgi:hypothetical protein